MRTPIFTLLLTALLSVGCDDSGTTGGDTSTSPSSGSTVAAPPPITPTATQPTTQPIPRDPNDVTKQHRQNHNIPATPETAR